MLRQAASSGMLNQVEGANPNARRQDHRLMGPVEPARALELPGRPPEWLYHCLHHAMRTPTRMMAKARIIQFWNVTPKSVIRSVSEPLTEKAPRPEKLIALF